jgi:CheY-like chemotaxis protein
MKGFWLALKERPDVIFTDYHMAEGDGRYLLSRLKSTPATRDIPVIVFSARPLSEGERSALGRDLRGRGQAAAFLTKPISVGVFLKQLQNHVALPERALHPAFIEVDCVR